MLRVIRRYADLLRSLDSAYWTVLIYVQILGNVITQGKKLGKTVYVFSVDQEANKVMHGNYVPPAMKSKGLDARTWASKVSEVLGGKVSV